MLKENPASTAERQVSFDGSQSSDPDGSIQSWTLSFGDVDLRERARAPPGKTSCTRTRAQAPTRRP